MDENLVYHWLFSDIDSIIDFDGYETTQGDEQYEREQHFETGTHNRRPISDDSR